MSEANGAGQKERELPPRTWLEAYLLTMLRAWNAYGYELWRQLAVFGLGAIDAGTVYRTLRDMERKGLIRSNWDTSVTSGPARRVYTITDVGVTALGAQATLLEGYRRTLDHFFRLYEGGYAAGPGAVPADTARAGTAAAPENAGAPREPSGGERRPLADEDAATT